MTTYKATNRNLDYNTIENKLVNDIKNYVNTTPNNTSCIVGISGGIDSATVSTLCAKTDIITILVSMPIHQNVDELNRANDHMAWLKNKYPNIKSHTIDLTKTFETIKETLLQVWYAEDELYMALVNTRSRLRMATLYAIAQANQWLVIGTGNKVEDYGIWFFTKYGDGWVDLSPIGELLKSEVKELAQHMNINQDIIQAKPTDWLHPTWATDEDQIGASYDELERAMEQYDHWKRAQDYDDEYAQRIMTIYTQRHESNKHKMNMPPILTIS